MDAARILLLLVVVGIVVTVVLLRSRRTNVINARVADSTPLVASFFARTGYAFDDLRNAPPAVQTQRWEELYRRSTEGHGLAINLVRFYQGIQVHWENVARYEYRKISWSQTWSAPAPAPISAPFHLTERRNLQPSQGSATSNWRPAFDRMVPIGDPELDHRFALFTPVDEQRIRAIVTHPQLRQQLVASAYVDLRVMPDGARFSDPSDNNAVAMLGGPVASIPYLAAPGRKLEITVPLHDRVANILLGAVSLAR